MKSVGEVLELYDGDKRLAFLLNATSIVVKESLNGENYVQFVYPRLEDDLHRYGMLTEQLDLVFPVEVEKGQRYTIHSVEEVRQGRKMYKVIEAQHVAFNLGGYFYDDYIDFAAAKRIEDMLTILGANTPYSFYVEGNFEPQDIFDWGEKRKIELLHELRELYNAELSFDNYDITLTSRKGENHGALIQYRHNMKGIKRKSQDMERITRLYGYGKNGLTIEGYGGHAVKYIDSEYFDPSRPLMGKIELPEIDDKSRLLQEMQKYLRKNELPNVSYDVEFVQLEKIDHDLIDDKIHGVGDTVTVRDDVLGYSFEARVNSFERFPFDKKSGRVVLTNFREMKTSDYIFQATVGSKKAITFTNKNAVLKGVKYDDSITIVDGMGMAVSDDLDRIRVRMGQVEAGEYGLAMYNKAGAKTIWQDATTGDGRFSGRLIAASGSFSGSLTASYFEGGIIVGSYIATSTTYPRVEMSTTGNMFGAYQSASNYAIVTPLSIFGSNPAPGLEMKQASTTLTFGYGAASLGGMGLYTNSEFEIQAMNGFYVNNLRVSGWSSILNHATSQTLQQALDTKANKSAFSGNVIVGDRTLSISNGVITSVA